MKKRFFLSLLLIAFTLEAKKAPLHPFLEPVSEDEVQPPWFTGPLLASSSLVVPIGHYSIEPYIFMIAHTGRYGSDWKVKNRETFWNNYLQPSIEFGLTKWMDFFFDPTFYYNFTKGASDWAVGDMPVGLDFQVWRRGVKVTEWISAIKFSLKGIVPFGKYRNLNPKKLGTDIGGGGSWQTGCGLVWGNLFYLGNDKFLSARMGLRYFIPAPVHVKNLNTYGGARGTHGTVYPAQNFQIDIGTELSLTKNWVFACDLVGTWTGRARFKGHTTVSNTAPPATQFSLAPAIEYNWNNSIGIIFGPWFTFAGRNANQFAGGIFAFNYYH